MFPYQNSFNMINGGKHYYKSRNNSPPMIAKHTMIKYQANSAAQKNYKGIQSKQMHVL